MAAFDVATFMLEDILRIAPKLIYQYTAIEDQLLYLILIPHVVLLLFVYIFADGLSRMALPGPESHKGFKALIGIIAYISIIMAGWYGTILVPIFIVWWQISLVVAFILFIVGRFYHPAAAGEMFKLGAVGGGGLGAKRKQKKQLEKDLQSVQHQINTIQARMASQPAGSAAQQMFAMQLSQLETKKAQIEAELGSL